MASTSLFRISFVRVFLSIIALLTLCACAKEPPTSDVEAVRAFKEINDPLEPWNRAMMQVDQGLDTVIFNPSIAVYKTIIPEPGRQGVTNILRNFRTPVTLVNDVLQGEGKRASITLGRFIINSTLGLLGFFDVAQHMNMPYHFEDFGQTLAVWGASEGPYLYVPILGPSGFRDATGYAVDTLALDPIAYAGRGDNPFWWQIGYFYGFAVDVKTSAGPVLDELKASSIDYYAAVRSAYRQNRGQAIRNGLPAPEPLVDEFDEFDEFDELDNYRAIDLGTKPVKPITEATAQ